jgi:hypothetical protein
MHAQNYWKKKKGWYMAETDRSNGWMPGRAGLNEKTP